MRNKLIITTLLASLFLLNGFFLTDTYAQSQDKLKGIQSDRQSVQQNISNQEKELNKILAEMKEISEEVALLNNEVEGKQAELAEITNDINDTLAEVTRLQEEIKILDEQIEQRFDILKSRAVSYQKTGGTVNYLEVIFGSKSFSDFISRLGAVTQIVDADAALMAELNEDMKTVEKHQQTTVEKLDELNALRANQEELLITLENEQAQLAVVKSDLEKKEKHLVSYVEKLQNEDAALASMESEVKNEIALALKKQREAEEAAKREQAKQKQPVKATEKSSQVKTTPKQVSTTSAAPSKSNSNSAGNSSNKKTFTVNSTAYTANCGGCSGITSTGINLKKNPNSKVIAVDPNVIPLGSTVYVEGYGYAIAGDTGGSIRGNKIDVFFPNKSQAYSWGRRTVQVTVQ